MAKARKDHAASIAANAAVVREAFARAAAVGAPRCQAAYAALAVVERWLGGEPVGTAELTRAQEAAHTEGQRWWKATERLALSASWSGTAAGNLCWMTLKLRGWQNGDRSILDAAVYTVSSTLPNGDIKGGLAVHEAFTTLHRDALTKALATPAVSAKAPPQRRLRTIADLRKRVGTVAAAYMRRAKARIDPSRQGDEGALRARLAKQGYPAHRAALAFEKRWGGLVMGRGGEGDEWVFGAYACAESGARGGDRDRRRMLVPVGCSPNDVVYFLDATGAAWGQDTIEEAHARATADDGDQLVATIALFELVFEQRLRKRLWETTGLHGARLARRLKLPAIREATSTHVGFWGDGKTLVAEVREGKGRTLVAGVAWKKAEPLLADRRT